MPETPRSLGHTPMSKSLPNSSLEKSSFTMATAASQKSSRPHSVLSRARTHSARPRTKNEATIKSSEAEEAAEAAEDALSQMEPEPTPGPLSRFSNVEEVLPPEIELLEQAFKTDDSIEKAFLAGGNFHKDDGMVWSLPVIRTVESQMTEDLTLNKEYIQPSSGLRAFTDAATRMLFGDDCPAILENRIGTFHTPGGTAALHVGLLVLRNVYGFTDLHLPYPSRGKYETIVEGMGFDIKYYKYLDDHTQMFDTETFLDALENSEQQSIFIIQADAPTGPGTEGWDAIAQIMWTRHLLPFFHISAQGLATGNTWIDSLPIRHFGKERYGLDMMVAQSFSKTFGLSGERCGCLCVKAVVQEEMQMFCSFIAPLLHNMWEYPPYHGGRVVTTVIQNPAFFTEWKDHIKTMSDRIRLMRHLLYQKMLACGTLWKHLVTQSGLFTTTGFTESQIETLRERDHIYIESHGIINISCLRMSTVDNVARCFHQVVQEREDMEELAADREEILRQGLMSGVSSQS